MPERWNNIELTCLLSDRCADDESAQESLTPGFPLDGHGGREGASSATEESVLTAQEASKTAEEAPNMSPRGRFAGALGKVASTNRQICWTLFWHKAPPGCS
eukprot:4943307-Pyramimonas_sp.AAC.1